MFIINATKANARIPVKSTGQLLELAPGDKSPELNDKLYNELIPFIRAFKLTVEGYQAHVGSGGAVQRHSGNAVASDPKANSGTSRAKAREERVNAEALKKAEAVRAANASKAAAKEKAEADAKEKAEADAKAKAAEAEAEAAAKAKAEPVKTDAPVDEKSEAAPKTPAKKRATPRRATARRKTAASKAAASKTAAKS